jgi:23S rRNA (guanosine2251-2'-O)-methyltransferase
MPSDKNPQLERIEGRNPVLEALRGPRRVSRVYLARGTEAVGPVREIISLCSKAGVPLSEVSREQINEMAETASPQGVVAEVAPYRYYELREIPAPGVERTPLLLALDGIEDPQNLGSLLRVAEAAGVDFVIIPRRRSAHVTAAVAKASAGAVEHVKIAMVSGISGALSRLKETGYWVVGAESRAGITYWELDLSGPLVLVLGGEGGGLGRLVRERCDFLAGLPMLGKVSSLNVANAGAVLLYEALRQRTMGEAGA